MILVQPAAVRVDFNVIKTGMAEYFCIHVAAAITPEVEFTALYAERNLTAITEDDGRDFSATRAGSVCVCNNDHDLLN
ncbi:MAG: hypothetical protein NTW12_13210 [Deltaproteobacteria bacterium]|nr:hypothetical protein [Deltaproteobacteria bacterium]